MGFTATEIKDFASKATDAMSQVKWFHGIELYYRAETLGIIKYDIRGILSRDMAAEYKVTTSMQQCKLRERIRQHMQFTYDGTDLSIAFKYADGSGRLHGSIHTTLRAEIAEEERGAFELALIEAIKFRVATFSGDRAEKLAENGFFQDNSEWAIAEWRRTHQQQ